MKLTAEKPEEMVKRITGGEYHDYYEALDVIDQYVTITGKEEGLVVRQDEELTLKTGQSQVSKVLWIYSIH